MGIQLPLRTSPSSLRPGSPDPQPLLPHTRESRPPSPLLRQTWEYGLPEAPPPSDPGVRASPAPPPSDQESKGPPSPPPSDPGIQTPAPSSQIQKLRPWPLTCEAFFSLILILYWRPTCTPRPALLGQVLEGDLLSAAQTTHRAPGGKGRVLGSKPWRLQPSHPDTHLLPSVFAAGRHLGLLTPALRGLLLVPQLQGEKAGCWKGPTAPASGARTHSYAGLSSRMLRPHAPRPRGGRGGSVGSSECLANGCAAFGSLEFSQPPLVSPPEGSLHLPGGPAQRGPRSPCLLATAHRALAQPPHRSSSPGTASAPSPDPSPSGKPHVQENSPPGWRHAHRHVLPLAEG